MPRLHATSLALLLLGAPLAAQEPGPAPLKDCRALLKFSRGDIDRTPATQIEDIPGGCRFTHVHFMMGDYLAFAVDEFILRSPGLLATYPTGQVFVSADMTLNGLEIGTGQKLDFEIIYTTDPAARTARLEHLSLDAGELGRFKLFATLSDFDNTALDSMDLAAETGRLHELDLDLEDNGLVARFFSTFTINAALNQTAIATAMRALPETMISAASAEAIARFVTALPEPQGRWTLHMESPEGLPLADLGPPFLVDIGSHLPPDISIAATAEPRP